MKQLFLTLLAAALVSGCAGGPRQAAAVRFDLGTAGAGAAWRVPLAEIDVQAASWLATTAMHYRLAYAEPLRRLDYNESRWAAPPAELLAAFLKRRQASVDTGGPGCRLHLTLDEFEQHFEDSQTSRMVLEARAVLLPARGSDMLARRGFRIQKPTATADARGAAAAAREAAVALADELAAWSGGLDPVVVARCRN
jgi:cholesterol transport system auxiliary component